ncbi:MAG: hypothetical protein U0003_00830 [Vampirovibrionales bacterium]
MIQSILWSSNQRFSGDQHLHKNQGLGDERPSILPVGNGKPVGKGEKEPQIIGNGKPPVVDGDVVVITTPQAAKAVVLHSGKDDGRLGLTSTQKIALLGKKWCVPFDDAAIRAMGKNDPDRFNELVHLFNVQFDLEQAGLRRVGYHCREDR